MATMPMEKRYQLLARALEELRPPCHLKQWPLEQDNLQLLVEYRGYATCYDWEVDWNMIVEELGDHIWGTDPTVGDRAEFEAACGGLCGR